MDIIKNFAKQITSFESKVSLSIDIQSVDSVLVHSISLGDADGWAYSFDDILYYTVLSDENRVIFHDGISNSIYTKNCYLRPEGILLGEETNSLSLNSPDFKVSDLLSHNEIISLSNPEDYSIYYGTDTNDLYVFDGSKWRIYNND